MDRELFEKQYKEFLDKKEKSTQDELDTYNAKAISHDDLFFTFNGEQVRGMTSLVIAMEEMSELQKEISKVARNKGDSIAILEELADVYIMMDRIKMLLNISDYEFDAALKVKVERLKKSMINEEDVIRKRAEIDDPAEATVAEYMDQIHYQESVGITKEDLGITNAEEN